jgi:hypothetical protein
MQVELGILFVGSCFLNGRRMPWTEIITGFSSSTSTEHFITRGLEAAIILRNILMTGRLRRMLGQAI